MTLEGLSSVCAKLELGSSKNNEIPEINVLQSLHCLYFKAENSLECLFAFKFVLGHTGSVLWHSFLITPSGFNYTNFNPS